MGRKVFMDNGQLVDKREFERRKAASAAERTDGVRAEQDCFKKNAFLFYSAAARILADEDLSFIPVPFENNLAYSGTQGLSGATLGVYVKWWQTYKAALFTERRLTVQGWKDEPRLLYFLAGSPLSGANGCSAVDVEGKSHRRVVPFPFSDAWRSFIEINQSYPLEQKKAHLGDTLQDAVRRLREDPEVMAHYAAFLKEVGA